MIGAAVPKLGKLACGSLPGRIANIREQLKTERGSKILVDREDLEFFLKDHEALAGALWRRLDIGQKSSDIRSTQSGVGEQTMDTLFSWNARRAGGRITVTHSCGKIVGVDTIKPEGGAVIATDKNGCKYKLHVA